MASLEDVLVSQANARQRRGRAGRVRPGAAIHLITSHRHNSVATAQQAPEVQRVPLEQLVLQIKVQLPHVNGLWYCKAPLSQGTKLLALTGEHVVYRHCSTPDLLLRFVHNLLNRHYRVLSITQWQSWSDWRLFSR